MTAINLTQFMGEQPLLDPKKLPLGFAVKAINCNFATGSLEPIRALGDAVHTFDNDMSGSLERYPFGRAWVSFSGDVDMERSTIANDAWDRVYWTDGIYPKYSTSDNALSSSLKLGIPKPSTPAVSVSGEGEEGAIDVDCAYIVTYVSRYGEEGPASDASNIVTRADGKTVSFTSLPTMPSGAYDIQSVRIYRTEGYGTFNYVGEVLAGQQSFADNVKSEALGDVCPSLEWIAPDSQMIGLTAIGNGVLAGFFENNLCFCEPYQPHAWPVNYYLAFPSKIVAIAMTASGIVVTTEAEPWIVVGAHPSSMGQRRLDSPFACVSKHSMVDMGEYVLYASNDGLVAAAGSGDIQLVTSGVISASDFKLLSPETWKAYRVDDRYFALTNTGCISFSPKEGFRHISITAEAAYFDKSENELYLLLSDRTVRKWSDGENLQLNWKSGVLTVPPRLNLTCGRVDSDGEFTMKLFLDGTEALTLTSSGNELFRLPAKRFRNIQVEIIASNAIHSVSLAQNSAELV